MRIKDRNIARDANIDPAKIASQLVGKEFYCAGSTGASYTRLYGDKGKSLTDELFTTLATGYAAMTTGRNDRLYVTPDNHSLASSLTWSLNCSQMVGLSAPGRLNQRSRIGMSTTFTPMWTVSGYGNYFENLYFMHGTAAGDYVGTYVTGNRNVFKNVHFGGPMAAAQGGHASYEGVKVTATECYFEDCTFGTGTIERDELSPNLTITVPASGYAHNVFRGCTFLLAATDTDPYFVKFANTSGILLTEFDNCRFIAISSNMAVTPAVAFTFSSGSTACTVVSPSCEFVNVTNICASASHKYVHLPTIFAATADELNLIAKNNQTF